MERSIMNIKLNAYGKINLFLDVKEKLPNGYHEIESIMQGIEICDVITIKAEKRNNSSMEIILESSNEAMPKGPMNFAIKGANEVLKGYKGEFNYFKISIKKNLPIAAGLAGGTADGATVMLGINKIIGYKYSLEELIELGNNIGSDFPFSISMNCYMNKCLLKGIKGLKNATSSAIIKGTGEKLLKIKSIPAYVIILNPNTLVSTKEVYEGLDRTENRRKLNSEKLLQEIEGNNYEKALLNISNAMEDYTLLNYKEAEKIKVWAKNNLKAQNILMSGSGPTIVAYYINHEDALGDFSKIDIDVQKYITKTG